MPTNQTRLSKTEKVELPREYGQYYQELIVKDESALTRKVPREVFADMLDEVGTLLLCRSKEMAKSCGTVRRFLETNPLPPKMASLLPDEFRAFCLALNALKQWVGAEQKSIDQYLLGLSSVLQWVDRISVGCRAIPSVYVIDNPARLSSSTSR